LKTTTGIPTSASESEISGRREEILDVATAMFAANGFAETDTQAIVEKLQVGKGTLYRYFPSKRDLFLATVDRVMRCLRSRVDATIAGVEDPMERLALGIRTFLTFFSEHPEFVELIIQERALFKDRKKPTYFVLRENHVKKWQEVYRTLIAQGRLRDMPVERISDVVGGVLYGTMFLNYFAGQTKSSEEQAKDILDVILNGILSPSERRRKDRAEGQSE
jgi:AcrR family transcriptional regulator